MAGKPPKPRHHGRDHLAGGEDPIPGLTSGGSEPPPFQPVPLLALYNGAFGPSSMANAWGGITDSAAIGGGTFTNAVRTPNGASRTPAINDFFTLPVMFGPKGSAWALHGNWKLQPDGGKFIVTVGSIVDTNGELSDDSSPTYLNPLAMNSVVYFDDTYQIGSSYDGGSNVYSQSLVIGGDDGAPFTSFIGTDPDTDIAIIDGGAGVYRWKLEVTGKNASSSGYRIDLMNLTWVRVDKTAAI